MAVIERLPACTVTLLYTGSTVSLTLLARLSSYFICFFVHSLGPESVNLPYLCRVLHAAAHFDLLAETSDDKYMLTPLSEYLTSSHPKSLKGFVKLYSGQCNGHI